MLRWDSAMAVLPPNYCKPAFSGTKKDWHTSQKRSSADFINPHNRRQHSYELHNPDSSGHQECNGVPVKPDTVNKRWAIIKESVYPRPFYSTGR